MSGKLDEYRARVLQRLDELKVEPRRAELVVGRAAASWLAPDVARLIAMIKSIADGMAGVEETFPPVEKPAPADAAHDPQTGDIKQESLQGSDSDQRTADENPEPARAFGQPIRS